MADPDDDEGPSAQHETPGLGVDDDDSDEVPEPNEPA
jgi:hypothetical protein